MIRRAARTDRNHSEIAGAFVSLGMAVRSLAAVGGGIPDLIVSCGPAPDPEAEMSFAGVNVLVEVKDGEKPPSARKLTPEQIEFRKEWRGPVATVKDLDGVETVVKIMRRFHAEGMRNGTD